MFGHRFPFLFRSLSTSKRYTPLPNNGDLGQLTPVFTPKGSTTQILSSLRGVAAFNSIPLLLQSACILYTGSSYVDYSQYYYAFPLVTGSFVAGLWVFGGERVLQMHYSRKLGVLVVSLVSGTYRVPIGQCSKFDGSSVHVGQRKYLFTGGGKNFDPAGFQIVINTLNNPSLMEKSRQMHGDSALDIQNSTLDLFFKAKRFNFLAWTLTSTILLAVAYYKFGTPDLFAFVQVLGESISSRVSNENRPIVPA